MNGPSHYREAERLRERAAQAQTFAYDATLPRVAEHGWRQATYFNAAAQVHATLAVAAALTSPDVDL